MKLVKPHIKYQSSYLAYIVELGDEERYPFPMDFDHHDFPAMLQRIADFEQGVNLPLGYVPSTTYWLVQGDEILGAANLRHQLNDVLRTAGGHIGLGIRPKYRQQGLSVRLLQLTLEQAENKGINPVHVHCYQENIASARMIMACGGVLDSEIESDGVVVQRYLI
ncbi:MAG: GNAT family N-acetyltransferase [Marinicella sp.]|nr:GNAT family N-acetyltransferase [Xanthomonadales bacterium]